MTAFCALAGLRTYRRSQNFYRALAAAFVTGFIASYFSSDRPCQITCVLTVATVLILEYRRWMGLYLDHQPNWNPADAAFCHPLPEHFPIEG